MKFGVPEGGTWRGVWRGVRRGVQRGSGGGSRGWGSSRAPLTPMGPRRGVGRGRSGSPNQARPERLESAGCCTDGGRIAADCLRLFSLARSKFSTQHKILEKFIIFLIFSFLYSLEYKIGK